MTRILRLAAVLALSLAALLATTSLAGAATPQPKLTPKQQQALCIAKKSVELLAQINKQKWSDPKAKAAAVKAIPAQAKAACPLPGNGPTPPTPAQLERAKAGFDPPADRVESRVRNGVTEYVFSWDNREIPADVQDDQALFTFSTNCPDGFQGPGGFIGGYTAANPANQGTLYLTQTDTTTTYHWGVDGAGPAEPRGISFNRGCTQTGTVLPPDPTG